MSLIKEKGEKHSFATKPKKGNCQTTNLSTSKRPSQIFRITFDYIYLGTNLYVLTSCALR